MLQAFRGRNLFPFITGFTAALTFVAFYRLLTHQQSSSLITNPNSSKRRKVVFFGDSITQHGYNTEISGWVAMFAHYWSRRADVVNRGFSGYNSRWGRQIVDKVVTPLGADLVFVFFGANDAVDKTVLQHVPLEEYRENLVHIVQQIRKASSRTSIVLVTPPPVWEDRLQHFNSMKGKSLLIDRTNERTYLYAATVKSVGAAMQVPVVDAWSALEGDSTRRADFLSDGLHLSARGCERLFEEAKRTLLKNYPEYNAEIMSMEMPEWSAFESSKI